MKPEYEYNLDLAKYFLKDNGYNINDSNSSYFSLTKTKIYRMKKSKVYSFIPIQVDPLNPLLRETLSNFVKK